MSSCTRKWKFRIRHMLEAIDRIDFQIVWDVIQQELSPLVPQLEQIMQEAED